MSIKIDDKVACTGCEACANICPKNCIEMKTDTSGFWYPSVMENECIHCELCVKACPIKKQILDNQQEIEVYAGWSLDESTRFESTSGGFFSELAEVVLSENGYVVGAAYSDNCDVEHIIISSKDELNKIRQSKYTQSKIGLVYKEIKYLLDEENLVLFCGSPCQVAGLKSCLNKEYENLYTVDFICRGMNSPKAYRFWLDELEEIFQSKANRVWFKYKINGWKRSPLCTRVDFENGKKCIQSDDDNLYMKGYLGPNLYIRPSCGDCQFKDIKRYSDVTLADFWGVKKELDDDKGTSLILLNSEKGRCLFGRCSTSIFAEKRELSEIVNGNVCFKESVKINPKSEAFLMELGEKSFSASIKKYVKTPWNEKIINKLKVEVKKLIKIVEA